MTLSLTKGNPAKLIFLFSIPLIIGNVVQQIYSLADAIILGNVIGVHALAAVGSTGSITFLIFGFTIGACTGLGMLVAQRFGANDEKGMRRSVAASYVVAVIIALALTIISAPFARNIMVLLRTPTEVIDYASVYIFILLLGNIIVMMFNLQASIIRAVGDSKTPLYFLVIAVTFNIALVFLFVLGLNLGVAGAAIATVIGQLSSVIMCFVYIRKRFPVLRLTREDWRITGKDLLEHFRMAIPMGLSLSIVAVGFIVVQYVLNDLGHIAVAGVTAAMRIDTIAVMPLSSFGVALGTFVAQNYGAGRIDRVKKGVTQCIMIVVGFSFVMGTIIFFGGYTMSGFFVGGDSEEVQRYAQTYLRINGAMYFVLSLLFVYRLSLQGLGKALAPAVGSIAELVMRIFAALILSRIFGFVGICWANPLAWVGATIPLGILYYTTIKNKQRLLWVNELKHEGYEKHRS
jgi:putative MATE family efflux protein